MNESASEPIERPECTCNWLHDAAADPKVPVKFSAELSEFHLLPTGGGYWLIYFCPFCGGRAPKSLRDTFFAQIPPEEEARFNELTKDFKTMDDVRAAWGAPDSVKHTLNYEALSTTAHVVAYVVNGEWRGVYLHRKTIKQESSGND